MKKGLWIIMLLLLSACGYRLVPAEMVPDSDWVPGMGPGMQGGTAWGEGAFDSNGERIYFSAVIDRGERIRA